MSKDILDNLELLCDRSDDKVLIAREDNVLMFK